MSLAQRWMPCGSVTCLEKTHPKGGWHLPTGWGTDEAHIRRESLLQWVYFVLGRLCAAVISCKDYFILLAFEHGWTPAPPQEASRISTLVWGCILAPVVLRLPAFGTEQLLACSSLLPTGSLGRTTQCLSSCKPSLLVINSFGSILTERANAISLVDSLH